MYRLLLCLRYLKTRYIALACIVSVTLGVATMIVVNSVMAGFSGEMKDRIHGLLADIILETHSLDGQSDPEAHMARIRQACGDDVEAMTATVEVYGMLSFEYLGQWITRPVTIIGIDPAGKAGVGPLREYLDSYRRHTRDGKLVREPLRERDVPLGWTLTDEARAYREQWVRTTRDSLERHRSEPRLGFGEEFQPFDATGTSEIAEEPAATKRTAEGEPVPETFEPDTFDPAGFESPDGDSVEPPAEPTAPPAAENEEDVFGFDGTGDPAGDVLLPSDPAELFGPEPGAAEIDPTQPLRGKLYVGSGLISFPETNPATGEVETRVMVRPGDDVKVSTVTAGRPPNPVHFNATVVDVFKSGMSEYDSSLVFCNLEYLQEVRGMIAPATGARSITSIQLKLRDYDRAEQVIANLRKAFPAGMWSIRTWEEKQGPLLAAVEVESAILNVLLFLIIAVAGFGILAIFYMIVVEKTRDIGILKALGASSRGVMSIFLGYGLALGVVGAGMGVVLGLTFVHYINEVEDVLSWITGRKVFDQTIYYFPEIPTVVNVSMVAWVSFGAMLIAVLASILPARRAAGLRPVEALRFE